MQIAVTADVHLTSASRNPERYHALENILAQAAARQIPALIIAGDLFDASCDAPGEFERLAARPEFASIKLYVLPGNHDPFIGPNTFACPNVIPIREPTLVELDEGTPFLFVPYQPGAVMGEVLANFGPKLPPNGWCLVAHGDLLAGHVPANASEGGLYMPLSGRDLALYRPRRVFLGHIHLPLDRAPVWYPGSPCGLDPTETGYRSFLTYDTASGQLSRIRVKTDMLYFNERLLVVPVEDEDAALRRALDAMAAGWGLAPQESAQVRLRLSLEGYAFDRDLLLRTANAWLNERGYASESVNGDELKIARQDPNRTAIAEGVRRRLAELPFRDEEGVSRDDVMQAALEYIYGGKK